MTDHPHIVRSFRDLKVWQESLTLAAECQLVAQRFARRDRAGSGRQLVRAANSVPANIAEGCGRRTRAGYLRYLSIANGSLLEVETHLRLAERQMLLRPSDVGRALGMCVVVGKLLAGLIRALRALPDPDPRH